MLLIINKVSSIKSGQDYDGRARVVSYLAGRVGHDGANKVKIFFAISFSYIIFWGPLFTVTLVKDFQIKIKHFIYTDQYLVAFGMVSEVYFSGGLCKADKWFIFI